MSVVSDFKKEFELFGTYDPSTEQYTSGAAFKFDQACQHAKVDVDEILADLIITKTPEADRKDSEKERNTRIEAVLVRNFVPSTGSAFNPGDTREQKVAWVKQHLTMAQKIAVLSEVQALEGIVGEPNSYPDDVFKARKQKSDAKKECIKNADKLKEKYQDFLARLNAKIKEDENAIFAKNQEINELSKGVAGKETEAKVTPEAAARINELKEQIKVIQKELNSLRTLYGEAAAQSDIFIASVEHSLRDNKLFEKDEKKEDDKSTEKSSGSSIKSPYSSLSDRGKQAADSEEAHDLYQSFSSADTYSKFLMLTGLDSKNMLEIARNISNVGERKDLQEYCEKIIDSGLIELSGAGFLQGFSVTIGSQTFSFDPISKSTLKNGLSESQINKIKSFYERVRSLSLKELSVEDLARIQNYSNALLVSSTLQEAKWSAGKQVIKGWLHLPGRKKDPHYDLATDIATFMRPLCERKDQVFKAINKEVDKGIEDADNIKYGPNTAVQHGQRKFQVRSFDHDK